MPKSEDQSNVAPENPVIDWEDNLLPAGGLVMPNRIFL